MNKMLNEGVSNKFKIIPPTNGFKIFQQDAIRCWQSLKASTLYLLSEIFEKSNYVIIQNPNDTIDSIIRRETYFSLNIILFLM